MCGRSLCNFVMGESKFACFQRKLQELLPPALLPTHRLTTQRDVSAPEKRPALPPYCYAVLNRSVSDSATPWTVAHQAPLSMTILQPRRLEWVAMPSSRDSSQPRDGTRVSPSAGGFFTLSHQGSPRSR